MGLTCAVMCLLRCVVLCDTVNYRGSLGYGEKVRIYAPPRALQRISPMDSRTLASVCVVCRVSCVVCRVSCVVDSRWNR
jgi:hypothetical protein